MNYFCYFMILLSITIARNLIHLRTQNILLNSSFLINNRIRNFKLDTIAIVKDISDRVDLTQFVYSILVLIFLWYRLIFVFIGF
jgi:hypothetical protein